MGMLVTNLQQEGWEEGGENPAGMEGGGARVLLSTVPRAWKPRLQGPGGGALPEAEGAGWLSGGSVVSNARLRLGRRPPPGYTLRTVHPAPDALGYPSASLQPARGRASEAPRPPPPRPPCVQAPAAAACL